MIVLQKIAKGLVGSIFMLLCVIPIFLSSCINDHCNEQMYTPLSVHFYSEIDTAKEAAPLFMGWMGEGTDSLVVAKGTSIALSLNPDAKECRFAVAIVSAASEKVIWVHYDSTTTYKTLDGSASYEPRRIETNCYLFDQFEETLWLAGVQDSFYVFYKPDIDTLQINYEPKLEFVSAECGCMNTFEIKSVRFRNNRIGSPSIHISNVNNMTDAKHIKLYLENY